MITKANESTVHQGLEALKTLKHFIGLGQRVVLTEYVCGEEGKFFSTRLTELANIVKAMPGPYQQDGKGDDAIVYLHYFSRGFDWYITERDSSDEQIQAFGLCCLFEDELGYVSLEELFENQVELDFYWVPKTLGEVRAKRRAA